MRKWLADLREAQGLTQHKVADLAGISQSYYAAIETGERGNPLNVDIAKKIAKALDFDWQLFYPDDESTTEKAG